MANDIAAVAKQAATKGVTVKVKQKIVAKPLKSPARPLGGKR